MKKLWSFLVSAVFPLVFVNHAYGYIDPGTGSMIVQAVIAGVAMVSVSIGIFWRRIRSFFGRLFGRNKNE